MSDYSSKDTQAASKTLTNSMISGSSFFGFNLPSELATPLRFAKGYLENLMSYGIAEHFHDKRYEELKKGFENLSGDALDKAEAEAKKNAIDFGSKAGTWIVTATKLIPTAIIGKNYFQAKRALSAKIDPISRFLYPDRGFFTFGHAENRILQFASDQVHQTYNAKLLSSFIGFGVSAGTQIYTDKQRKNAAYENEHAKTAQAGSDKTKAAMDSPFGKSKNSTSPADINQMLGGLAEGGGALIESHLTNRLPKLIRDKSSSADLCLAFANRMEDRVASLDPLDEARLEKEEKVMAREVADIVERVYAEAEWRKMPETVSQEIEAISRAIVRPMLEGRLDPLALVKLLGEDKVIRREGASIIDVDELKDMLDELCPALSPERRLGVKAFFEQGGIEFSLEDVTRGWEQLSGSEKSLFALLLSDKILLAAGASKGDIEEYNRKAESLHPSYEEQMAMAMISLAELPDEDKRKMFGKSGAAYIDNAAKLINKSMKEGAEKYEETITHVARLSRTKNILATTLLKSEPGKFTEMIETKRTQLDEKTAEVEKAEAAKSEPHEKKTDTKKRDHEAEDDLHAMMDDEDLDDKPKADWSKLAGERKMAMKDRGLPGAKSASSHSQKISEGRLGHGAHGGIE